MPICVVSWTGPYGHRLRGDVAGWTETCAIIMHECTFWKIPIGALKFERWGEETSDDRWLDRGPFS